MEYGALAFAEMGSPLGQELVGRGKQRPAGGPRKGRSGRKESSVNGEASPLRADGTTAAVAAACAACVHVCLGFCSGCSVRRVLHHTVFLAS